MKGADGDGLGSTTRDAIHQAMAARVVRQQTLEWPWERSNTMGEVFGRRPTSLLPSFNLDFLGDVPVPSTASTTTMSKRRATGLLPIRPTSRPKISGDDEVEGQRRRRLLDQWQGVLQDLGSDSVLGRSLSNADADTKELTIADSFSSKATATLALRLGSWNQYKEWYERKGLDGTPPLIPSEDTAYSYLCDLRRIGAPRTRSSKFLQTMQFIQGLVSFDDGGLAVTPRLTGAATRPRRDPVKRRDPLSVRAVILLEKYVAENDDEETVADRVVIGFALFVLHCRARYSDALRLLGEPTLDVDSQGYGFVEGETMRAKNIKSRAFKHGSAPLVGLATGVSDTQWARQWLKLRASQGLDVVVQGTLNPAKSPESGWSSRSLSSQYTADLVKHVLIVLDAQIPKVFGSHSLKATWLSWLAKAGVPADVRAILGGHVGPNMVSVLTYSRDQLAQPMRHLERVARKIRSTEFDPDCTRSGRWRNVEDAQLDAEPGPDSEAGSDSEAASTSESSTEASVSGNEGVSEDMNGPDALSEIAVHQTTGIAHLLSDGGEPIFKCGRKMSLRYEDGTMGDLSFVKLCALCFK